MNKKCAKIKGGERRREGKKRKRSEVFRLGSEGHSSGSPGVTGHLHTCTPRLQRGRGTADASAHRCLDSISSQTASNTEERKDV